MLNMLSAQPLMPCWTSAQSALPKRCRLMANARGLISICYACGLLAGSARVPVDGCRDFHLHSRRGSWPLARVLSTVDEHLTASLFPFPSRAFEASLPPQNRRARCCCCSASSHFSLSPQHQLRIKSFSLPLPTSYRPPLAMHPSVQDPTPTASSDAQSPDRLADTLRSLPVCHTTGVSEADFAHYLIPFSRRH